MKRVALALLIVALGPASADAATTARPADGQLWEETRIAQEYWAVRGYTACDLVVPTIAPIPAPDDYVDDDIQAAYAEEWTVIGSCKTALVPEFAAITRERTDYFALRYECAVVVHGVGHALGLDHDATATYPVMGQGIWDEAIPGRCRAWARRIARARRAEQCKARPELRSCQHRRDPKPRV